MVKYNCDKCGKEFTQKSHYTKHINKKNPCVYEENIEKIIKSETNIEATPITFAICTVGIMIRNTKKKAM